MGAALARGGEIRISLGRSKDLLTTTKTTFEIPFKNCTFPSLALKDVYIKHFYDLLTFYWHLADCRSIVVLAPLTYSALLSAQYKPQNIIKQFIKSNLFNNYCACNNTARAQKTIRVNRVVNYYKTKIRHIVPIKIIKNRGYILFLL